MFDSFLEISSSSELILLSIKHKPSYGAEISQKISEASNYYCLLTAGNLYPLLKRLEQKGFLEAYQKNDLPPPKSRRSRKRKYYKITEKGLAALAQIQLMRDQLDNGSEGTSLSPSY